MRGAGKSRETKLNKGALKLPREPTASRRAADRAPGRIVGTPFHLIVIPFFPSANKRFGARVGRATGERRKVSVRRQLNSIRYVRRPCPPFSSLSLSLSFLNRVLLHALFPPPPRILRAFSPHLVRYLSLLLLRAHFFSQFLLTFLFALHRRLPHLSTPHRCPFDLLARLADRSTTSISLKANNIIQLS